MGNEKEELKASIHNQNYRLVGITSNEIAHMTGKLTLNILRNSKQRKRKRLFRNRVNRVHCFKTG